MLLSHRIGSNIRSLSRMNIKIIPAFEVEKNYMYLIIDEKTRKAAAVDPIFPEKIIGVAEQENANITHALITHHHGDHSGGNLSMAKLIKDLKIVGGDDRIPGMNQKVIHDEKFNIGENLISCIHTPCHTRGHICYFVQNSDEKAVFTGDTLFVSGCGHFFEGTPDQMYDAMINKLSNLPDDTKVYVGHEYTVNNLKYASHVEPENKKISEKLSWAEKICERGEFTVPSTIREEKDCNPFMRVQQEALKKFTGELDPIHVMGLLRQKKNGFKL